VEIECIKEKLKNALALADRITGKNLTLQVLGTVLLIAKGSVLKIIATNLDLGIEITLPVKIKQEGVVAISGGLLFNILSYVHENAVFLRSKKNTLSIITKNSSTFVKTYNHDDFPTLPKITKENTFSVDIKVFVDGLKSVWYSTSISDIKPEISSVYIYNDSGNIFFVATDSFRLAEKKIKNKIDDKNLSLLVPFKNVNEIIRTFDGMRGDITVSFRNDQLSIAHENIYLTSRIIDGTFPDYKQILPKEYTTEVIVLKQELLHALKLTQFFSDKLNQVVFTIKPSEKIFEISSKNSEVGENTVKVDSALSGDSVVLKFNHKYILDCFQSITKDSVSLKFSGENKPLVIEGVGDKSFMYLVMPLNQ